MAEQTHQLNKRKGVLLIMDMKLEVLFVPVSDVDRAKLFYEKLGFRWVLNANVCVMVKATFKVIVVIAHTPM
jgi:predicted lactoylglutathione lyase